MKLKSFQEFLNEEEKAAPEAAETADPKTKDQRLGYKSDGAEVMSKMKVGHTIELTPEDFKKIENMRVTQYERDMYNHERGGKDYKISKDAEGKCTIFHYNKTIHELTPIGVFKI
jgi:hypothetical protein